MLGCASSNAANLRNEMWSKIPAVIYLPISSVMNTDIIDFFFFTGGGGEERTFILPADREAVADRILTDPTTEAVDREHLVRVVVLQDVPDRPDGLLVLVEPAGAVEVVQALRVRWVPVAS